MAILKTLKTGMTLPKAEKPEKAHKGNLNAFSLAGLGIGGVIGAGYFLGSGLAVRESGPSVILAFLLGGLIMMQVLGAMSSINVNRLERGSFRVYVEEFLGSYAGFLVGWAMFISSILGIGSEAIAMGVFARFWLPHIALPILATSFSLIIILLNTINMENFGRIESGMSALKVLALLMFIVLGGYAFVAKTGVAAGNPFSGIGSFFPNGISGFMQSMLVVIFAYTGISAVAMAATEVSKPKIQIPAASKMMAFGTIGLYVLSMLVLMLITPWNKVSTTKSPFVMALDELGMDWAAASLNVIILLAAFSVMAASYYASIQLIVSLSSARQGPRFFLQHSRRGFYRNAWIAVAVGVLAVMGMSFLLPAGIYHYLISASSYFTFLSWSLNIIAYVIWRKRRCKDETYESKLIFGRLGAFSTLAAILVLFFMSLRVGEFRMGFYAAAGFLVLISLVYFIWFRLKKNIPETHSP